MAPSPDALQLPPFPTPLPSTGEDAPLPSVLCLRHAGTADLPFLLQLYGALRAPELAAVPWGSAEKLVFVADQFRLQHCHYLREHPHADYWVINAADSKQPIGRLSLDRNGREWRLMEISLRPEARGQGTGTR